jgi:magnesium transporter
MARRAAPRRQGGAGAAGGVVEPEKRRAMPEKRKRRRPRITPGMSPGTLVSHPDAPQPVIRVMAYGRGPLVEEQVEDLDRIRQLVAEHAVIWVNVDGVGQAPTIEALGKTFQLHPLALEDVVNVTQRPKVEDYGEHLFIVARMPVPAQASDTEQVSFFLGRNFVLTFQEQRPGDCLEPVRARLRRHGRIVNSGPDYLAYALLDAIVDSYFPVLENHGDDLERLESAVLSRPDESVPHRLHALKRELEPLRRILWSFRDVFTALGREEGPLVSETTRIFLRDCYDHTLRLLDLLEGLRESSAGLMELYLSTLSHKLNEIMKVLTIIATVFIPLSFIAGIYGMNFDRTRSRWNMPELGWPYGYVFALGLMLAVALGLLYTIKRRGWFGSSESQTRRMRHALRAGAAAQQERHL